MQIYTVGGAVRDSLLNRPVKDRDFVVCGATPEQMLALGYRPVGKDFPVFLHPKTQEEYALARTERKQGRGYHGFVFCTDVSVTIEQDLARRDLTINAIAQDADGKLIDPYNGQADIKNRVLRHVSDAFTEDPVRILRIARFAARFADLGFRIAPQTLDLMRQMVRAGEVDHLVSERVWQETQKSLAETKPSVFIKTLRDVGALKVLFPEVDALYGVPQREEHHPEVDTGIHTEMVLDQAARLAANDALVAFCALTHDLGKALTPKDILPKHHSHDARGVKPLNTLAQRLKVPTEYLAVATAVCKQHINVHQAPSLRPATLLKLLESLDVFRRPQRLMPFLLACEADARGRLGKTENEYPQKGFIQSCYQACIGVQAAPFIEQGLQGPDIAKAIRKARMRAIADAKKVIS